MLTTERVVLLTLSPSDLPLSVPAVGLYDATAGEGPTPSSDVHHVLFKLLTSLLPPFVEKNWPRH